MRRFENVKLQWRITLLTALVLTICSVTFTIFSIYNAQNTYLSIFAESVALQLSKDGTSVLELHNTETIRSNDDISFMGATGLPAQRAKRAFDASSIIFCFVLTIIGSSAVYFVTGKALQPVRDLSIKILSIDENNLSQRLPESKSKDEVGSMSKSFNHMLVRLEDAFNRQKRFTASAAHELKTPLATMKVGIQVLGMDENTTLAEYKENARITEINVDRLTQMVNDLLLLASVGEGVEEVKEEIDLSSMFDAIYNELMPLYENRGITYAINCNPLTLFGNMSLLYRAFYNLLENAYKYNRENGCITVSAYEKDSSVKIDIKDNGYGIPPEHLPLVFEAFYRVDASRSRKIAGSGLGLSIVKSIVERHNGTISVSSERGKGTNFSIVLPR